MDKNKVKPGFVRVFIPERKRTLQIRDVRARDRAFMARHGMILMPDPEMPVTTAPVTPPAPAKTQPATKSKTNG